MRATANTIAVMLAAALLGACSSSGKKPVLVDPNIAPLDYKQEILDTMKRMLADPTNVRDAYLSDPALTKIGNDERYASCVRFNARDASRHYMGSKDRIAFFYGGHLNQLVEATPEQCARAAYKPFPELEKLCFAEKCT